jgi:hypothetical protein
VSCLFLADLFADGFCLLARGELPRGRRLPTKQPLIASTIFHVSGEFREAFGDPHP